MCGRFALPFTLAQIEERFRCNSLIHKGEWNPHYNLAPGQEIPVVAFLGRRVCVKMLWGFVPFWVRHPEDARPHVNARSETVAEKPTFRQAFRQQRCLLPAQGFYEWRGSSHSIKIPYFFHQEKDSFCPLGGIWQRSLQHDGRYHDSFALITKEANATVRPIHERMPLILSSEEEIQAWLDPATPEEALFRLLQKSEEKRGLVCYEVSSQVNRVQHDSPDLLARVDLFTP